MWQNHPLRAVENYAQRAVPIVVHGDGAVYNRDFDSVTTVQWSPLLVQTGVWESVYLVTAFAKDSRAVQKLDGCDTWNTIWLHI
eukprot:8741215-Alexandrium_andersonii.AAC.1